MKISIRIYLLFIVLFLGGECFILNKAISAEPSADSQEVTITTSKAEYGQGEEITASINYKKDIDLWIWGNEAWSIQRLEAGSWITIKREGDREFVCTGMPNCKDVIPVMTKTCDELIIFCERPIWYRAQNTLQEHLRFAWNQSYMAAEKPFKCGSCAVFEPVAPGKYKIRFEYANSINQNDLFDRAIDIKYADKEITIVGK